MDDVCQACGLCCDGSLYTIVTLREEELVPMPTFRRGDGTRAFRQRCAVLEGTRCGAYAARPLACQKYECLLYDSMRDKEIDATEALAIVARAKELIAAGDAKDYLARYFGGQRS